MDEIEQLNIVKAHVAQLSEHFETVQIFVTKVANEGEHTLGLNYGAGNWFARIGHVKEYVMKENARTRREI